MITLNSLRQDLLQKRLDLHKDLEIRDALEKSLIKYLEQFDQGCLAIYWPINSEFDPRPLALNWARQHATKKLALPIVKINQPLIFAEWHDGDKLEKGPQGIPQPILNANGANGIRPNIILLPCLGWSSQKGHFWRLGYGGGYYDRTLESYRTNGHAVKAVGVAYGALEIKEDAWRPQSHDQALDELICA